MIYHQTKDFLHRRRKTRFSHQSGHHQHALLRPSEKLVNACRRFIERIGIHALRISCKPGAGFLHTLDIFKDREGVIPERLGHNRHDRLPDRHTPLHPHHAAGPISKNIIQVNRIVDGEAPGVLEVHIVHQLPPHSRFHFLDIDHLICDSLPRMPVGHTNRRKRFKRVIVYLCIFKDAEIIARDNDITEFRNPVAVLIDLYVAIVNPDIPGGRVVSGFHKFFVIEPRKPFLGKIGGIV